MPLLQRTARALQPSQSHALREAGNMPGTLILEKILDSDTIIYQIEVDSEKEREQVPSPKSESQDIHTE